MVSCARLRVVGASLHTIEPHPRQHYSNDNQENMMIARHELQWTVGFRRDLQSSPEERIPAQVPGAVQYDWGREKGWRSLHYGENWRDYRWMEDVYWSYLTTMELPEMPEDRRLFFVCKGVDYRFLVRLNGEIIREQEGMFTPFELELTGRAATGDQLEVLIFPAPKSVETPEDRTQANQSCKPAVSYGWDFHPRLIPLGIWDDTYLETRPLCHLRDAEVQYTLSEDFRQAALTMTASISGAGAGFVKWSLLDAAGNPVMVERCDDIRELMTLQGTLDAPRLWWPNGQGDQVLYTSRVELCDASGTVVQAKESRVGFRRVRLVMNPGAWDEPDIRLFPKSRSATPITLEINGRAIFSKGSNWVCPDVFPGTLTAERYREQLLLAKAANMNLLRQWGGAIVNKDAFYEICDELGLMIWQEFPLACNRYEGTPGYLQVLDQESRSIITRLRRHACLVMWCGGNELFNCWSLMTDQDLALRLLNRNCFDLDPSLPFLMTSPLEGMGHGHYVFRNPEGKECFQLFAEAHSTAYTEFGVGGPAPLETLRAIIPAEEQDLPPRAGTAWESHHAVAAWEPNSHLLYDVIERYYGPCESLEQMVQRGQFMQGEGLKCLFEEARRQKPHASMALNWCFNEPWKTAANLSIIAWPSTPKPAYYQVANALRPQLASARIAKFQWKAGELFTPELFLLNDAPTPLAAGRVEAYLRLAGEEIFLLAWDHAGQEENCNLVGPIVRFTLPEANAGDMTLVLRVIDHPEMDSEYSLLYVPAVTNDNAETRKLNF